MPSEIRQKVVAGGALTITLGSLATGTARQSTLVSNSSNYPTARLFLKLQSGAVAPTAGLACEVYLLRAGTNFNEDNCGASDAAITVQNAQMVGSVVWPTASANTYQYAVIDLGTLDSPLGASWGIAIKNSLGQALHATGGNHVIDYVYIVPEAQ